MATVKRCNKCGSLDDGTLAGRLVEHQHSVGHSTYQGDLCHACADVITVKEFLAVAERVGRGHLKGADIIRSLPVVGVKDPASLPDAR